MLGASWYVRHPFVPLERTIAALNIDGANLWGETDDISAVGLERSTLGSAFETHAATLGLRVEGERAPGKGFFFRSDHFPFARAGVPAIAFDHGLEYVEKEAGWGERWYEEFNTRHYHQPTDAFREDFDYRGALQQARVMLRVAHAVANAEALPDWMPGSAFQRPVG